ncbi:hypothetical protein Pmani_014966 [Petrolisthes manimaculis]|uniref:Caspase family p10 domain-containing protein n=1 Tax=Petrolisthes manimaculis TaxID=1843537 RepID=A0AAE1PUU6_9EUCA|nr:hypothetical protein Pmani_014966 [Petrolisthes manimaculis]
MADLGNTVQMDVDPSIKVCTEKHSVNDKSQGITQTRLREDSTQPTTTSPISVSDWGWSPVQRSGVKLQGLPHAWSWSPIGASTQSTTESSGWSWSPSARLPHWPRRRGKWSWSQSCLNIPFGYGYTGGYQVPSTTNNVQALHYNVTLPTHYGESSEGQEEEITTARHPMLSNLDPTSDTHGTPEGQHFSEDIPIVDRKTIGHVAATESQFTVSSLSSSDNSMSMSTTSVKSTWKSRSRRQRRCAGVPYWSNQSPSRQYLSDYCQPGYPSDVQWFDSGSWSGLPERSGGVAWTGKDANETPTDKVTSKEDYTYDGLEKNKTCEDVEAIMSSPNRTAVPDNTTNHEPPKDGKDTDKQTPELKQPSNVLVGPENNEETNDNVNISINAESKQDTSDNLHPSRNTETKPTTLDDLHSVEHSEETNDRLHPANSSKGNQETIERLQPLCTDESRDENIRNLDSKNERCIPRNNTIMSSHTNRETKVIESYFNPSYNMDEVTSSCSDSIPLDEKEIMSTPEAVESNESPDKIMTRSDTLSSTSVERSVRPEKENDESVNILCTTPDNTINTTEPKDTSTEAVNKCTTPDDIIISSIGYEDTNMSTELTKDGGNWLEEIDSDLENSVQSLEDTDREVQDVDSDLENSVKCLEDVDSDSETSVQSLEDTDKELENTETRMEGKNMEKSNNRRSKGSENTGNELEDTEKYSPSLDYGTDQDSLSVDSTTDGESNSGDIDTNEDSCSQSFKLMDHSVDKDMNQESSTSLDSGTKQMDSEIDQVSLSDTEEIPDNHSDDDSDTSHEEPSLVDSKESLDSPPLQQHKLSPTNRICKTTTTSLRESIEETYDNHESINDTPTQLNRNRTTLETTTTTITPVDGNSEEEEEVYSHHESVHDIRTSNSPPTQPQEKNIMPGTESEPQSTDKTRDTTTTTTTTTPPQVMECEDNNKTEPQHAVNTNKSIVPSMGLFSHMIKETEKTNRAIESSVMINVSQVSPVLTWKRLADDTTESRTSGVKKMCLGHPDTNSHTSYTSFSSENTNTSTAGDTTKLLHEAGVPDPGGDTKQKQNTIIMLSSEDIMTSEKTSPPQEPKQTPPDNQEEIYNREESEQPGPATTTTTTTTPATPPVDYASLFMSSVHLPTGNQRSHMQTRSAARRLARRLPNHAYDHVISKRGEIFKAAETGDVGKVRELIQDTGPAIRHPHTHSTLLHAAASTGQVDMVLLLLAFISPNTVDNEGRTPAHVAAKAGHTHVLRVLKADKELDHQSRDNTGYTYTHLLSEPLAAAVVVGEKGRVQELLRLGADPDRLTAPTPTAPPVTPRHLAHTLQHHALITLFPQETPSKDDEETATTSQGVPLHTATQGWTGVKSNLTALKTRRAGAVVSLGPDVYPVRSEPRGYVCILDYNTFKDRPHLHLGGGHNEEGGHGAGSSGENILNNNNSNNNDNRTFGCRVTEHQQDTVCLHSSSGGFTWYSFSEGGSIFTRALCSVLTQHAHHYELQDLYRELVKECTKTDPAASPQLHNIVFTKKFYFNPTTDK